MVVTSTLGCQQTTAISRTVPLPEQPVAANASMAHAFQRYSVDAELLLQAGRGRRVLENEPLVGIDVTVRFLSHQRRLMEAAQDQLQLARISIDVADCENPRHAGLERRRFNRDQVVLQSDAP